MLRPRALALAVAGVVVLASAPVLLGPAVAAGTPVSGVPLPQLTQQRPSTGVAASSSEWLLMQGGKDYDERDPTARYRVVRRADGVTVRTFDAPQPSSDQRYQLSGDDLVKPVVVDNTHSHVDVTDVATGAAIRTINTDGSYGLVHAEPTWALVGSSQGLRFVHADGSTSPVQGSFSNGLTWVGGGDTTAYVTSQDGDFALDPATGARTALPFTDSAKLFAVTPTTLIGTVEAYPSGVRKQLFRALDRTNLQPAWSVDVPTDYHETAFVPLGAGVAAIYQPDAPDPVYQHLQLRPVDLATGSLQAAAATDVYGYSELLDAEVALVFADTPGGRMSIADGTTVTPYVAPDGELPDQHDMALDLRLSGTTVAASWQERDGVWTTPDDGSGSWSEGYPAAGFAPGDDDKRIWFSGDVVMTMSTSDGVDTYHLQWPGGSRSFTATNALLSHGGTYVERIAGGQTVVENAITGAAVVTYTGTSPRPIDGDEIWSGPSSGVLTGTDLTGATPPTTITTPTGCTNALTTFFQDVRGHWAALTCGYQTVIVDLSKPNSSFVAPAAKVTILGAGYLVTVVAANPGDPLYATVTSLASGETRAYGPVRGSLYPPGVALAPNDDGTPEFVYLDTTYQPRKVDVSWVTGPPPPPTSPHVAIDPTTGEATVSWSWTPDAGAEQAQSFDVVAGDIHLDALAASTRSTSIGVPPAGTRSVQVVVHGPTQTSSAQLDSVDFPGAPAPTSTMGSVSAPVITGTARVGSPLTASPGTWSPADGSYDYQWLANGTAITGATTATYMPTAPVVGTHLTVRVTASKTGHNSASVLSAPTAAVAPGQIANTVLPSIYGTKRVGRILTARPGTWSPGQLTYRYTWLRDGRAIAGAHDRAYKLTRVSRGHRISVRVKAIRTGYTTAVRTSPRTIRVR
jgi:hypothetical protein